MHPEISQALAGYLICFLNPHNKALWLSPVSRNFSEHQYMSVDRVSSGSHRPLALPPFLHLAIPQENGVPPDPPKGHKSSVKKFKRVLHSVIPSRRLSMISPLEKEVEDANVEHTSASSHSTKHRLSGITSPRPSVGSIMSQSTSSHFPDTSHSPHALVTSFSSLNFADVPPKSPSNKSPFSAVLLFEDENCGEDDPALALWHTERLHRARLAKLTRHLGEEIPADLVLSPTLLSREALSYTLRPRRGQLSHQRRKSLDPSAFLLDSPVADTRGANLRRSRSLKGRDDAMFQLPTTFPSELSVHMRGTEKKNVCSINALENAETIHTTAPDTITLENHLEFPGNVLDEQPTSMETYLDSSASPSTRPSVETPHEKSPPPPRRSPSTRTSSRRPATADATRRVEKLADFFGVDHNDFAAVCRLRRAAQKLEFSSATAVGDLAIGIHPADPQVEADVKLIKPSRFWNLIDGRVATKRVHPDDVMNKLRTMRAS